MKTLVRLALSFVTFVASFYFVFWLPLSLVRMPPELHASLGSVISLVCAAVAAWFVWVKSRRIGDSTFTAVILGAVIGGAIGFAGGFFGPILLTPESNQGPLLGIFITGPLGVVVGAVAGFVWGLVRSRRPSIGSGDDPR